jgi:hypothetical protein
VAQNALRFRPAKETPARPRNAAHGAPVAVNLQVMEMSTLSTDTLLESYGYKLVEDAWKEHGRRTYVHDDDATREHILGLAQLLDREGWVRHPGKLRVFLQPKTGREIEVEPGGSEVDGHFLHHMRRDTSASLN